MLDDLRKSVSDDEDVYGFDDDDDAGPIIRSEQQLLFGMTPVERMFLSMFLFMNVTILGLALLLVTGHIG